MKVSSPKESSHIGANENVQLSNENYKTRCSSVQGVCQIRQNSEAEIWKPVYSHKPMLCSLIKHIVSANQSVHYMETL